MAKRKKDIRKRKRREKTEREKAFSARRSAVSRHVVPRIELSPTETQSRHLLSQMSSVAYIKRRVRAHCRKALEQLHRDRRWCSARASYHEVKEEVGKLETRLAKAESEKNGESKRETSAALDEARKAKKEIAGTLDDLMSFHELTFDACREIASHYARKTGVPSVFALCAAEDVWQGVEKVIYSDGRKLGSKWEDTAALRSKQANRAIVMKEKDGSLLFEMKDIGNVVVKPLDDDDIWLKEEIDALVAFLQSKGADEERAVDILMETGEAVSVSRPCYAMVYMEEIRGKQRFFANITMEGDPLPKRRADGSPRHRFADAGRLGNDIGVSSYAVVTDGYIEMANIGERGSARSQKRNRKRKAGLQRKMDSSLRANNPENYNDDGTVRKGRKTWKRSKAYLSYQSEYREICRKERLNREYGIREQVNHLRTLGCEMVTEDQSVSSWARKAKPGGMRIDSRGRKRCKSRKRFGKGVQEHAPGLFTKVCKEKFGDGFVVVDKMFRASQYDHELDDYVKKPLSQRRHYHSHGRASPRDAYSAFLLWCAASGYDKPDRGLCNDRFEEYLSGVSAMIADYRARGVKVRNSGF